MALNKFMHPRNRYKHHPADFAKLAAKYDIFKQHVSVSLSGKVTLDFKNPEALRALTCTLLKEDFNIELDVPLDRLVPTLPLRLNYIHWIEDIICEDGTFKGDHIIGIDIGTGASCIYPLLGTVLNKWNFTATETDSVNIYYAKENVKNNNFNDQIKVMETGEEDVLSKVLEDNPGTSYTFCMCNPPFYSSTLEAQGVFSRSDSRPEPKSISTAAEPESIVEGGEVEFIKKMITDSLKYRERVRWYTSMVGKKKSLTPLKAELRKHKIRNVATTEFCQGRTMRWGIAWTFINDASPIPISAMKRFKREKEKPPIIFPVPDSFIKHSVEKIPTTAAAQKRTVAAMRLIAVRQQVESILIDLQIKYKRLDTKGGMTFELTAYINTWSHQRRKRREKIRKKRESEEGEKLDNVVKVDGAGVCGDSICSRETDGKGDRNHTQMHLLDTAQVSGLCCGSICSTETDGKGDGNHTQMHLSDTAQDEIDCACSSEKITDLRCEGDVESTDGVKITVQNDNDDKTSMETDVACIDDSYADIAPECVNNTETDKHASKDSASEKESEVTLHDSRWTGKDENSSSDKQYSDELKSNSNPQSSIDSSSTVSDTPLLKCTLTIKNVNKEVVVEMKQIEGKGREIMHQVAQYFKNQFQRRITFPA